MHYEIHDILDEAAIAFETEGISERDMRDAIYGSLAKLASERLGSWHELTCLLDADSSDKELLWDLEAFNSWVTPNSREEIPFCETKNMNAGCAH